MESSKLQRRLDELAVEQQRVDTDLKRTPKLVRGCDIMTKWKYKNARAVVVLAGGNIDFSVAYVCFGKRASKRPMSKKASPGNFAMGGRQASLRCAKPLRPRRRLRKMC